MKVILSFISLLFATNIVAQERINKNLKISEVNANRFTVPLDLNLPEKDLNFNLSEVECKKKMGLYIPMTLNDEEGKYLCLSADSLQSSGSFLRVLVNYSSLMWAKLIATAGEGIADAKLVMSLGNYCKQGLENTFCADIKLTNTNNKDLEGLSLLELRSQFFESAEAKAVVVSALDHPLVSSELSKALGGLRISKNYKELMASLALSLAYTKVPSKFQVSLSKFQILGNGSYTSEAELELPKEWTAGNKGEFSINLPEAAAKMLNINSNGMSLLNKVRLLMNHNCSEMVSSPFGDKVVCNPGKNTKLTINLKNKLIDKALSGQAVYLTSRANDMSFDKLSIGFDNLGLAIAKSERDSCSWQEGKPYGCAGLYSFDELMYDDKANNFSVTFSQGALRVYGHSEAGYCKGLFAYTEDMTKVEVKDVMFGDLLPTSESQFLNNNFKVDITCYEEIEGSCECRNNGRVKYRK